MKQEIIGIKKYYYPTGTRIGSCTQSCELMDNGIRIGSVACRECFLHLGNGTEQERETNKDYIICKHIEYAIGEKKPPEEFVGKIRQIYKYRQFEAAARRLAFDLHKCQKYDGMPYVNTHTTNVVKIAKNFAYDHLEVDEYDDTFAAAWLHDAISDTDASYNDIKKATNERIADLSVNMCEDVFGKTRKERNSDAYYKRLNSHKLSVYLKLCDRIANVEYGIIRKSSMLKKYRDENEEFLSKLDWRKHKFQKLVNHLNTLFDENN